MCVNNLSKVALDSAEAGIEPAISSRKFNTILIVCSIYLYVLFCVFEVFLCLYMFDAFCFFCMRCCQLRNKYQKPGVDKGR